MKVFLDTNVLVSAFASHGACADLFEHCLRNHRVYIAERSFAEIRQVLGGKIGVEAGKVEGILDFLSSSTEVVKSVPLEKQICRDPDDDFILGAALLAGADCIITGDEDLLVLKEFAGVKITSPSAFWRLEKEF
jgi:putative PIN family toxin of toxin-antitoxin system